MDESVASHRTKRQKIDKHGRFSALERFKQLREKGERYKYDVDDVDNVYDEVDESEYSKKVLRRQQDDWIVEDGSGYVEDGREIFDDDLDDESIQQAAKKDSKGPKKRKRDENKGKITNMFMNIKKKADEVSTNDDNVLEDLMSELKKTPTLSENRNKAPKKNKFAVTPKNKDSDDEKIMASLIMEDKKAVKKTIQEDDIYSRPAKHTLKRAKSPSPVQEDSPELFTDDFLADDFVDDMKHSKSTESKNQNEKKLEENLGDDMNLADVDFEDDVEMNTSVASISTPSTKSKLNSSKAFKDDEVDFPNDDAFAKLWEGNFTADPVRNVVQTNIDTKTLPLPKLTNEAGDEVFRFFWYDAFEDPWKQPGVVYLFGKVYIQSLKEYVSCCVSVKNVPRKIFLLPKETVKNDLTGEDEENNLENVHQEFNDYTKKVGINQFRFREVTKKYAFEREDTPAEADYMEVQYSASDPALPANYTGRFIEGVFGTTTTSLELLLIERNIKGPCWIDIKKPLPMESTFSWCKTQVRCMQMNDISPTSEQCNLGTPPMVIATLNVQINLDTNLQKNEVVMIGVLLHHKFHLDKAPPRPPFDQHYCFITHPKNTPWPLYMKDKLSKITKTKVIRCENELDLLEKFLDKFQESEPDLIIGYDCEFQFDVLLSRMFTLKVKNWSKIGKLKKMAQPFFKGKIIQNSVFCGRPVCDITSSAKELNLKVKSYDLMSLCVAVLNKKESECKEVKPEECQSYYSSVEKLEKLIYMIMTHASFIQSIVIELNVLPLALQITNICGNTLSRTFSAGRSERNEFLLLHAFHSKDYIMPDKRTNQNKKEGETTGKKKPQYLGGLVLEPKAGFYDKLVLLMDFNSLYPSIIQEYNLCFTTVPGAAYADLEDLELPDPDSEPGIVPTEIRKLVQSRVEVKKLMKAPNISPELRIQYDIRQLALKLTANSMYGCLGAVHNRFYAKGLAALVTSKGREILQNTKALVEKENYDVIYGDTDSIMINTNILDYEQVFAIGREIKQKVNKLYKKVELDIDGVFKYLLMLKKKKYAAVTITKLQNGEFKHTREMKGLDIVRRDWCNLACDVGKQVLDFLLSDKQTESRVDSILELMQKVSTSLREGKEKLASLVITKQLSKNPNEYPTDKKGQLSHVLVARRLNSFGGRMWKKGDVIPYIVCEDGTDRSATERVYHIDEFKKSETLKIDINYYLLNQIHPVVLRICNPIEGIDDVLLAENLGIKNFKSSRKVDTGDENEVPLSARDNRYEKCVPLRFVCKNESCKTEIEIKTVFTDFPSGTKPSLSMCANPSCNMAPWKYVYVIQNKIKSEIRRFLKNYYSSEVECENPICCKVMRRVTLDTFGHNPKCSECKDGNVHRIYTETDLYNQLSFYMHLFTLTPAHFKAMKASIPREVNAVYDSIKEFVEEQIHRNAYSIVDLTKLFWSEVQESDIDADVGHIETVIEPLEAEDLDLQADDDEEQGDAD